MPTGYTVGLEERKYNVKEWITQDVVRAFGICIELRDDGKLDEEEILKKLDKEKDSHYEESLKEKTKELELVKERTKEEWEELCKTSYDEQLLYHEKEKEKIKKKTVIWNDVLGQLNSLKDLSKKEINSNIINFAIEQWQLVEDEYKKVYSTEPIQKTWKEYKKFIVEMAEQDLKYYSERKAEEEKRNNERLEAYKELIEFIKSMEI